jgi:transcriptional regulator with XRE-family HTH domain
VRELRHARGLTLVQVATAAGLSHPFLSQLEHGRARPSMASLFRIAEALGTTQQSLLASAAPAREGSVTRADEDDVVDVGAAGPGSGGARLLTPAPPGVAVTEFIAPVGEFESYYRHEHAELLYVVSGTIEVEVVGADGPELSTLSARDSLGYPGGVDHRFRQLGELPAVVLVIHGGLDG